MKFFHTADWHIGKTVNGFSMLEDQRHVLQQLIEDIKREKPDAVIVAGDLYDQSVPSAAAVALLDEVIHEIVINCKTPLLAVAGNHDGPTRIHFASGVMKSAGLHLHGQLEFPVPVVKLRDQHGEVHFHMVPYADPTKVRNLATQAEQHLAKDRAAIEDANGNDEHSIRTHDEAMHAVTAAIRTDFAEQARHVLIGHAFVTPQGEPADNTSDSEKPLAVVGGAEHVSAAHFADFHYVALGHLHREHAVGHAHIRYSGSILKYSLSEALHEKGYLLVDLHADGSVDVEKRTLRPRRELRKLEATIAELERLSRSDDYVFVTLLDDSYVIHAPDRVRTVFPNAMSVERHNVREEFLRAGKTDGRRAHMNELSLFHDFYEFIQGEPPSESAVKLFSETFHHIREKEREET